VISIYGGVLTATYWTLLYNGFVPYRKIQDGGALSLTIMIIGIIITFFIMFFMLLDTALGFTGVFTKENTSGIFTLYFLFPIVAIVIYVSLQTYLCISVIYDKRPLWFLYASLITFIAAEVILFIGNKAICIGLSTYLDGIFFSTLVVFMAIVFVEVFFESTSEDEFDFET
jgi:hypothetical protein